MTMYFYECSRWNIIHFPDLLAVKYIHVSINKSKPVQFLMTHPNSMLTVLCGWKRDLNIGSFAAVKLLKGCQIWQKPKMSFFDQTWWLIFSNILCALTKKTLATPLNYIFVCGFRYMVFKDKLKPFFFKNIVASVFINLCLIIKIKNVFLVIYIYIKYM